MSFFTSKNIKYS